MELLNSSVKSFTEQLASKAPVPGGGGASALVGAIGVALGDMVGELTVGKQKYADVGARIVIKPLYSRTMLISRFFHDPNQNFCFSTCRIGDQFAEMVRQKPDFGYDELLTLN